MKIERKSIKDQVYDTLKDQIIDGQYGFGEPLNISALSSELGVSNTPIREVFTRLETEGLLVSSYNSQVRVIDISEELIYETDATILALLLGSYDLCLITGKTKEIASMLENALNKQKKMPQNKISKESIIAAIQFDKCFVAATGNEKLTSLFDGISPILFMMTNYLYKQNIINQSHNIKEHEEILEVVKNGDTEIVREKLQMHYNKHFPLK